MRDRLRQALDIYFPIGSIELETLLDSLIVDM